MAEPDVILFALEHRSSIRSTLFVPTLSLSLSFLLVLAIKERRGEKGKTQKVERRVTELTWKKKKRDERGAGKWMIVVAFCRESGLLGYRIAENGFDFIFDKDLIFLDGRGGRGRSSLIFARHTAGKSFTSISACENFLAASPTRFRAVEGKRNDSCASFSQLEKIKI